MGIKELHRQGLGGSRAARVSHCCRHSEFRLLGVASDQRGLPCPIAAVATARNAVNDDPPPSLPGVAHPGLSGHRFSMGPPPSRVQGTPGSSCVLGPELERVAPGRKRQSARRGPEGGAWPCNARAHGRALVREPAATRPRGVSSSGTRPHQRLSTASGDRWGSPAAGVR